MRRLEGFWIHLDAVGMDLTVFDPDLDPDGILAVALTDTLVAGLGGGAVSG